MSERQEQILAACRTGAPLSRIGQKFGITRQRVSQIMRRADLGRDDPSQRYHVAEARRRAPEVAAAKLARKIEREAAAQAAQHRTIERHRAIAEKVAVLRRSGLTWQQIEEETGLCWTHACAMTVKYCPDVRGVKNGNPGGRRKQRLTQPSAPT